MHVMLQAYHEMAVFLTKQGTLLGSVSYQSLEKSWKRDFVNSSRSPKDLIVTEQ